MLFNRHNIYKSIHSLVRSQISAGYIEHENGGMHRSQSEQKQAVYCDNRDAVHVVQTRCNALIRDWRR